MRVAVAALLSAVLFYLSMGPENLWALAWVAPVPVLWLAYGARPAWQVALASVLAMVGGAIYVLQCYPMFPWLSVAILLSLFSVLFAAAVLFALYVARYAPPLVTLFAYPACWSAMEYLIGVFSPNGTNGSMAYSQMSAPMLIQSASLLGAYVVTFLLALFASSIALALHARRDSRLAVGVGLALCLGNVAFGLARLAAVPQHGTVRVAAMVVDSPLPKALRTDTLSSELAASQAYASAIRRAAQRGATLAVTPEGRIFAQARWRDTVLAPLAAVSRQTGVQIVAGVVQAHPWADLAFAFSPDGKVLRYAKRHLVPGLESRFTPGHVSGWLGNGLDMAICMDMDFAQTLRKEAARGVRLMAVPGGDFVRDAWIHGRVAVMRGVENGFALVRPAYHGLVLASDAEGRVVAEKTAAPTGLTMIVTNLAPGPGPTLYTRIGDVFPWGCIAASLAMAGYALRARIWGLRAVPRSTPA